ncbi:MAG: hypothetical protein AB8G99_24170 [Planctomycetaceae bacterium]
MAIGFETTPSEGTSDAQFLTQLTFDDDAPRRLVKAAKKQDITRFVLVYRAWLEPVATRFRKRLLSPVLNLLTLTEPTQLAELIREHIGKKATLKCGLGRAVKAWLQSCRPQSLDPADRLLAVEMILNPPVDIEVETWCRLWRLVLVSSGGKPSKNQQSLVPIEMEVDFLRSLLFAPLKGASPQNLKTAADIESLLLTATDTDGTPHATALNSVGKWFAGIVRCAWWARAFRVTLFGEDGRARFKLLTERVAGLSRADGSFAMELAGTQPIGSELLPMAAKLAGIGKKTPVGRLATFDRQSKPESSVPSSHSDWGQIAHLRSNLQTKADQAVVRFDGGVPSLELCSFGKPLVSGKWNSKFTSADRVVSFRKWSCSCWYSDEDGDYVEIESKSGGVRLERSLYLSRVDHFAVLTECVRTTNARPFQYETQLPLAQNVMSRADYVSREWRLHTANTPARVFPVCLEFDRVQNANGECTVRDEVMVLNVQGERAVAASLVFDWHRKRTELPAEWNRLTVTENRELVPPSDAAAFRLRIGKRHQIVSYRNISDSIEHRAVLGQHTNREMTLGLLGKSGIFEPLVLVDA